MVSRTPEQIVMKMTIPQLKRAIELQKINMTLQEMSDNFYYIDGRRAMDEMVLHAYEKELKVKEALENFYYIDGRRAMDEMVLHAYEKELKVKEALEKNNEEKSNTSE